MGTSTSNTNEAQKTSIDPALKAMYIQNYADAGAVGQGISEYGPYQGQRVAGPTGAFDQGWDMMSQQAQTLQRDMPANLPGQTLQQANNWLNTAVSRPYNTVGSYGYDPSQYYMRGATVDPSQQGVYSMDRSMIQNQDPSKMVIASKDIRDVNYADFPRQLISNVAGATIPRSAIGNVYADQISGGMDNYQNKYTEDVINQGTKDLDRARQIAMQQQGSQAVAQGAFGGGRHGVQEAETNRGFADATARLAAEERSKGFTQAAQLSGQDVSNALAARQANQGADLSMAQLQQNANLTAGQANQNADLNQANMRQQGYLTAQQANQNRDLSWAQQAQQAMLQGGAANQNMDFQAAMQKLQALNTGESANADRRLQAMTTSAGYGQDAASRNQQAALEAQRYNAGQRQAADTTNQQAGFQNISQLLQSIQQGQSLAQQQYQMPADAAQKMMGLDQYSRGMTNEQIQAQMQAWDDQRYKQLQQLQLQGAALGMNLPNLGMSSTGKATTTQQPSLGQNLGQLAGIAGMFM